MKNLLLLILVLLATYGCEKEELSIYKNKDNLYGDYFGEPDPGETPQRFCPDFFSMELHSPPVFSSDGREVYWSLMGSDFTDILEMRQSEGEWSKPLVASFNLRNNNDAPFMTPDGQRLYFLSAEESSPGDFDENLYYVSRLGTDWSAPVMLPGIINNHKLHWEQSVAQNYNLYFQDADIHTIYRSTYAEGEYQSPEALPETVNSPSHMQGSPCIAPDESYIIFDRRSSTGDSDLYLSMKNPEGEWMEAIALGPWINTSGHEIYPLISSEGLYLFFLRMTNAGSFPYWVRMTAVNKHLSSQK